MTKILIDRSTVEQALEALEDMLGWQSLAPQTIQEAAKGRATALRAALAEPVLQTCNCRWDGEVQVQQCTLHEAHVDAIHEWAERAKTAEKKLAALAEPAQSAAWRFRVPGSKNWHVTDDQALIDAMHDHWEIVPLVEQRAA